MSNLTKIAIGGSLLYYSGMLPFQRWYFWLPMMCAGWMFLVFAVQENKTTETP